MFDFLLKFGTGIFDFSAAVFTGLRWIMPRPGMMSQQDYPRTLSGVIHQRLQHHNISLLPPDYPLQRSHFQEFMKFQPMKDEIRFNGRKPKPKKSNGFHIWFNGRTRKTTAEIELQPMTSESASLPDRIANEFEQACESFLGELSEKALVDETLICDLLFRMDSEYWRVLNKATQDSTAGEQLSLKDSLTIVEKLDEIRTLTKLEIERFKKQNEIFPAQEELIPTTSEEAEEVLDTTSFIKKLKKKVVHLDKSWAKDEPVFIHLLDVYKQKLLQDSTGETTLETIEQELNKVYKILARKYHPDRYRELESQKRATIIFQRLGEIFSTFKESLDEDHELEIIKQKLNEIEKQIHEMMHDDRFWKLYISTQKDILESKAMLDSSVSCPQFARARVTADKPMAASQSQKKKELSESNVISTRPETMTPAYTRMINRPRPVARPRYRHSELFSQGVLEENYFSTIGDLSYMMGSMFMPYSMNPW